MEPAGFSPRDLAAAPPIGQPHAHVARFQDVDAAGVVFFVRIIEYFHDAFAAHLRTNGMPLEAILAQRRWVAPIRECHVHFFKPIRHGDALRTALVAQHLEGSDLHLGYRVEGSDGPCAVGHTRAVFVAPDSFSRAAPPAEVVALFAPAASGSR